MVHYSDIAKQSFALLCTQGGTTYTKNLLSRLEAGDQHFLETLEMPEVSQYSSATLFSIDYLCYSYLKKYKGFKCDVNTKEAAFLKWQSAEEQCQRTNSILRSSTRVFSPRVEAAILRAQRKIAKVLGVFSYEKVLKSCEMGPGATFDLDRKSPRGFKRQLPVSVTPEAMPHARAWLEQDLHWSFHDMGYLPDGPYCLVPQCFNVVPGNRMTFVPKDAKTDRPISIEPTFNIFLQKGVGGWIRKRLLAFGVNLDDQSLNQELARLAFELGYATLDLSSASDTICNLLVALLLPHDWYTYLDSIRCRVTAVKNKDGSFSWHRNQKFSSMGNGFTFELESLIFWALAPECELVSVYGDDLICNQHAAEEYVETLETLGFTINTDKSYTSGRFFESCGKHFFDGIDVTPVYQKEIVSSAFSLIRAHNRIVRWREVSFGRFAITDGAEDALISCYSRKWKTLPYVPLCASDVGFITRHHPSWKYDPNRGWRCTILKIPNRKTRVHESALWAWKMQNPTLVLDLSNDGFEQVQDHEKYSKPAKAWIRDLPKRESGMGPQWMPPSLQSPDCNRYRGRYTGPGQISVG